MPDEHETKPGTIETLSVDGIGWLTFRNPTRHNALSSSMLADIPRELTIFEADPDVGVVVVHGAGDRAFVSGADISEFGDRRTTPEARAEYDATWAQAHNAWENFSKPVIAMIGGYCLGGGLNVALQADIRIAGDNAEFAIPAGRLGLGYGLDGVERLMNVVGPAWAAEMLFSARRFSAKEGLAMGLVNRVVSLDRLGMEVTTLAKSIAENAPLTVRACKAAIREAQREPLAQNRARVAELVDACFRSQDYLEGQRAFMEKRTPRFIGR
jgi:enoyl-CoA hydratase/carnithine racemase